MRPSEPARQGTPPMFDPTNASPVEVARLHDRDDVDYSLEAHHHTLGSGATQAASGNHKHKDRIPGLLNSYYVQASANTGQAILAGTFTAISGWTPEYEPPGVFATSTGIYTAPVSGVYETIFAIRNDQSVTFGLGVHNELTDNAAWFTWTHSTSNRRTAVHTRRRYYPKGAALRPYVYVDTAMDIALRSLTITLVAA